MFMLDTDMCIYLINDRDQTLRARFEATTASVVISSITYAELRYGVAHSQRAESNARELQTFCRDLDILPFGSDAGAHYGEIHHALARQGRAIGANDLLIAAHARCVDATLVTNNEAEFRRVPSLEVENWLAG